METSKTSKYIGNVFLDYSQYSGNDYYSDGDIENQLLEACKSQNNQKLLQKSNQWPILYHLSDIRENVIDWFPFKEDAEILEIGAGCGGITGVLSKNAKQVTCIELSERRSLINAYRHQDCQNITIKIGNFQDIESSLEKYDYITLIGVLEYAKLYIDAKNPYKKLLEIAKKHLKENGKLIIAIENKMGLKYWNGATEDHTGKLYSGLNDYIENNEVRTFSLKELEKLLEASGYDNASFYFPIPDYKLPKEIYSYNYQPCPGMIRTYKKVYSKERMYSFYEDVVSDQLCADGMFSYMANSYVIIAGGEKEDITLFAKYNRERKKEYRIATIIKLEDGKKIVEKKALSNESLEHVRTIKRNEELWRGLLKNIKCVNGDMKDDKYVVDYIEGKTFDELMYRYRNDYNSFISNVEKLVNKYLVPEKQQLKPFVFTEEFLNVFGNEYPQDAMSLAVSNVDTIFPNLKITQEGEVYAFDFEWVFQFPIPYRYIIWRAEKEIYYQYQAYLKNYINLGQFLNRLGMTDDEIKTFNKMEKMFGEYVCGKNRSEEYTRQYEKIVLMQNTRFC